MTRWYRLLDFFKLLAISAGVTLAVYVFPLLLDLWVENDSKDSALYIFLQKILNAEIHFIYFLLMMGVLGFLTAIIYRQHGEAKDKYEQSEKDKARTLLGLYDELQYFDMQKNLALIMERFCKKHDSVLAVQVYKYEELSQKNTLVCKVNYVDGYVKERQDLNGIMQRYYYLNKDIYKTYTRAIEDFVKDPNKAGPIITFILSQVDYLNNKPIRALNEQDAFYYAMLVDAYSLLKRYYPGVLDIIIDNRKMDKLEALLKEQKRVGIFRGILLNSFYTFYYDGKGTKEGRQYITNPVVLRNVKHIILITLDPFLLNEDSEAQMESFVETFENMLHETFEKEYNNLR